MAPRRGGPCWGRDCSRARCGRWSPRLAARSRGVTTDKVVIKPGQMKLFYVIDGRVTLHYNGDRHLLETGDSALLDGGTAHGWENRGDKPARALWVILG